MNYTSLEQLPFMQGFIRLCNDGWLQGWHERNGGNASYRLSEDDIESAQPFFNKTPGEWVDMQVCDADFGESYLLATGSGKYMRNVILDPEDTCCVVEFNKEGNAYRVVWGLKNGGRPTSEIAAHFMIHGVKARATEGKNRVIYHSHPNNITAMTHILPLDDGVFSTKLWQSMTECVMVFPEGVGVLPVLVPGSAEIALATSNLMEKYNAVIWGLHGMFCVGDTFDAAFGLMHAIEKAAEIYCTSRAANGGSDVFENDITLNQLRAIAKSLNVQLNESLLK